PVRTVEANPRLRRATGMEGTHTRRACGGLHAGTATCQRSGVVLAWQRGSVDLRFRRAASRGASARDAACHTRRSALAVADESAGSRCRAAHLRCAAWPRSVTYWTPRYSPSIL